MEFKLIFIISLIVSLLVLIFAWFNYLLNKESEAYKILKEVAQNQPTIFGTKENIISVYKFHISDREIIIRKIPFTVNVWTTDRRDDYILMINREFTDNGDNDNKKRLFDYVEELYLNQK